MEPINFVEDERDLFKFDKNKDLFRLTKISIENYLAIGVLRRWCFYGFFLVKSLIYLFVI